MMAKIRSSWINREKIVSNLEEDISKIMDYLKIPQTASRPDEMNQKDIWEMLDGFTRRPCINYKDYIHSLRLGRFGGILVEDLGIKNPYWRKIKFTSNLLHDKGKIPLDGLFTKTNFTEEDKIKAREHVSLVNIGYVFNEDNQAIIEKYHSYRNFNPYPLYPLTKETKERKYIGERTAVEDFYDASFRVNNGTRLSKSDIEIGRATPSIETIWSNLYEMFGSRDFSYDKQVIDSLQIKEDLERGIEKVNMSGKDFVDYFMKRIVPLRDEKITDIIHFD